MIRRYLLDANVVLRFLVQDHPVHAKAATRLFARAENGEIELLVTPWIVAEIVYGLSSIYNVGRGEISKLMKAIISAVGVVAESRGPLLDALDRYAAKNVDFADALLAAQAAALKVGICSFDRDLDKFSDVERFEP
jgi:predicted nucleic acid-binding protein